MLTSTFTILGKGNVGLKIITMNTLPFSYEHNLGSTSKILIVKKYCKVQERAEWAVTVTISVCLLYISI